MSLLQTLVNQTKELDNQLVLGLSGTSKSYVMSSIMKQIDSPVMYIAPNMLQASQLYDDLRTLLVDTAVHLFPVEESIASEFAIYSKDLVVQRIESLQFLLSEQAGIVIVPLSGVTHLLSPVSLLKDSRCFVEVGGIIELNQFIDRLHCMGYVREKIVESPGQFSLKGGILDIYPLHLAYPIRIELFDDEIDSIRQFDPQTQKSMISIESEIILPATDVLFSKDVMQQAATTIEKELKKVLPKVKDDTVRSRLETFFENLITRLSMHELPENPRLYTHLFYNQQVSILDYLSEKGLIVIDEYARLIEQEKHTEQEIADYIVHKSQDGIVLPSQIIKASFRELIKKNSKRKMYVSSMQKGLGRMSFTQVYQFQYRSMPQFFSQMPLIKSELERFEKQQYTVCVFVSDDKRAKKVSDTFSDFDIKNIVTTLSSVQEKAVNIVVGTIHNGFELPLEKMVFLNERELFNKVVKTMAKRQNLSNAERLKSYSELSAGDYVVHVSHGVGKYQGMETLDIGGVKQDYMSIIYQDESKLFIPVTQIHLVQKYVASDGRDPKLNKLGGTEWAKTKKKVAKKIEDIADELIELYAKREAEKGFAFSKDNEWQQAFEEAFPYAETPDQLRSVKEIKQDMERVKPMDRLLVGDVGYGKTEVAMRAIFKAVQDGKQAAFLVPTTVLAQQHYLTLTQRFEEFPVKIELLSRFRTQKQQKETIEKMKTGQVDVVVGTHRLVSKDAEFSDLGLLVIDEEQRFGVRHKERLKQLKTQVDVLTLTATPIPRTLHMSMLGVRDLSVIETPPANRYPVQTYVMEQEYGVIRDAIEREIARQGQIFYLYNRVDTILEKASRIRELVPQARVAIAHGQLSEVELERVLLDFMAGEYDVLVTTTIIETGVDLPNVNTLIIEDADRMGLSQLYQLRGRVGRTNRIAYAYFMYQPNKMLTETSEKRLDAIKEFTQLGAGFKIAMRDLSIRGAGNLLGQQQSGFIDSVGFDLYSQMLQEAIVYRQTGKQKVEKAVEIDLGITAYIPTSYIEDERQKIDLYKRIRTINHASEYIDIQDDMIDRFGDYPDEVADLATIGLIKYYAEKQDIEKIKRNQATLSVTYSKEKTAILTGEQLFKELSKCQLKAMIKTINNQLVLSFDIAKCDKDKWLSELVRYLKDDN